MKLESSTLPRTGHSGKSLTASTSANVPSSNPVGSSNQQTNAVAAVGEAAGVSGKRRSAAHLYRMQTESSLAKMHAGKDSSAESSSSRSSMGKKESYTMMRFPSTPNIASDGPVVDGSVESVKSSHRPRSVEDADESRSLPIDDSFKADNSSGMASVKHRADDASRTLMPPPLSSSVPLSYQATFIAKAAKHRRTTMPAESLARSRELLAGAIAKHHRLSESSSTTDADDSPPSSSSAGRSNMSSIQSLDTSPLEPPERDTRKTQNRVSNLPSTDHSAQSLSNAECTGVVKAQLSDNVSSADTPKIIKVGRCGSPAMPHSASSTNQRRQLPLDPRQSVSVTRGSSEHTTALDSMSSCAVPHSAPAESEIRLTESTEDTAVCQSTAAGRLSADTSEQRMSQIPQGMLPLQDSRQRPIASKTETRLVLSPDHDSTESLACTAQRKTVNDVEHYYTERRATADQSGHQEEDAADSKPLLGPVGHSRQQWEKSKSSKVAAVMSQSNSSVSPAASSSICDSSALADVSSLSRNSVNSTSSISCLTYNVSAVTGSVSDSIISYGSVDQKLCKLSLMDASGADANSSLHSNDNEPVEDNQVSALMPARYTDSLEQPVSAMSSDK